MVIRVREGDVDYWTVIKTRVEKTLRGNRIRGQGEQGEGH